MSELKPCPFCGGKPEVALGQHHFNDAKITCSCGVESGLYDDTEDKHKNTLAAVKAWNTRAPYPRVDRLVEAAKNLIKTQGGYAEYEALETALAEFEKEGRTPERKQPATELFPPKQCAHWRPRPAGCFGINCAKKAYVVKQGECPCAGWEKRKDESE